MHRNKTISNLKTVAECQAIRPTAHRNAGIVVDGSFIDFKYKPCGIDTVYFPGLEPPVTKGRKRRGYEREVESQFRFVSVHVSDLNSNGMNLIIYPLERSLLLV